MLRGSSSVVALCVLAGFGCGDSTASLDTHLDDDVSSSTTPADTADTADTAMFTDATSTDASTTDDGRVDTGFDPPEPECGNGFVEPGEQCDDGNDIDDDDCNNECLIPCGLEWEHAELPPTAESEITGLLVASDSRGGIIAAGALREVTTDREGMPTQGPREVLLSRYDASGDKAWETRIAFGQAHTRIADLAVDARDGIVLAMTVDATAGGSDIVLSKRSALDGGEIWQHVYDSQTDTSVDVATGVALTEQGDVVAAGTVRAGPMDDDAWVRKLGGEQGEELWTATWSGPGDGTFSVDRAGPIRIGPSGAIYVLGREHIDHAIAKVLLLRLPSSGPSGEDEDFTRWFTPDYPGSAQMFTAIDLEIDADENIMLAIERALPSSLEFWVHKLDAQGSELWQRTSEDDGLSGKDWRLVDISLDAAQRPVLVGYYRNEDLSQQLAWSELWLRRLDAAGQILCAREHRAPADGLLPASLFIEGGATHRDGTAIVTGMHQLGDDVALWLATFRAN